MKKALIAMSGGVDSSLAAQIVKDAGYEFLSAEKTKIPSTYVTLESEDEIKFMGLLIEKLEEDDDVMNVYHNWENCD